MHPSERDAMESSIRDLHRAVGGTWLSVVGVILEVIFGLSSIALLCFLLGSYLVIDSTLLDTEEGSEGSIEGGREI